MENSGVDEGKINRRLIYYYFAAFIFVNAFVFNFISRERYIYFWDYYHYWAKYQQLGGVLSHYPLRALSAVWDSIRHEDYNLLPVVFLMPFRLLFGDSRLSYILAIANTYVLPSAILCSVLVRRVVVNAGQRDSMSVPVLALAAFLLLPCVWIPVFLGYPDVAGVVVIFVIYLMLFRSAFEKMSWKGLVTLGLLLAFLVLLRRWYAYWVVAFFIALALQRAFLLMRRQRAGLKDCRGTGLKVITVGVVSLGVFLLLSAPQALKMISTDYTDVYSAYKWAMSPKQVLFQLLRYFGPAVSVLSAAGLLSGLLSGRTRPIFIFMSVQSVAVFFLFSRVQDFNPHHYYLLMPAVIVSLAVLFSKGLGYVRVAPLRFAAMLGFAAAMTFQLLLVFVPGVAAGHAGAGYFISTERHYPLVRNDIAELKRILDVLDRPEDNPAADIYVAASSVVFSDDILRNACYSMVEHKDLCSRILESGHVDKRDGFPRHFPGAGYIVVADPVQYHLRPEDQRVVGILAEDVLARRGVGTVFERLPYAFTLDNDVKVYIYKKVKPLGGADIAELERRLAGYYPGYREKFLISR